MNLVITTAGKDGLYPVWQKSKNYDVVVIHYEEKSNKKLRLNGRFTHYNGYTKGSVTHIFKEGFKFPLIKEYLETVGLKYDYYLFLDDDILINQQQITDLFKTAKKINAKVFSPSINPINMPNTLMAKNEFTKFRYLDLIEITAVGMNKETVKTLLPTFNLTQSGYGLPNKWNEVLNCWNMFCIMDEIEVLHTRPFSQDGKLYKKLGGYDKVMNEYNEKTVGTYNRFQEVKVYKKPLISVCTIFCDEDMELLTQQFETIPVYAEHVLVRTVAEKIEKPYIKSIDKRGERIWIEYCYPENEFSFADAMNVSIDNSNGFYFLKLDADERLLKHQQAGLYTALEKCLENGAECINFWTLSALEGHSEMDTSKQARVFRNKPEYRFVGHAHEHIKVPLDFEKKTVDSDFKIDHIGYSMDMPTRKKKMMRNIRGMLRSSDLLLNYDKYFSLLVRDCAALYSINDYLNKEGKT